MTDREFNDKLQQIFDNNNKVGLGELLLFSKEVERFFEKQRRLDICLKRVVKICKNEYDVSPREFVKLISYEHFKMQPQISDTIALGLKLFLLYHCGIDWEHLDSKIRGVTPDYV